MILEQKALNSLSGAPSIIAACMPRANEIMHRLVRFVRDPDCGELTGPQQPREHHRIPAVVLDPRKVDRLRNLTWGDEHALGTCWFDRGGHPLEIGQSRRAHPCLGEMNSPDAGLQAYPLRRLEHSAAGTVDALSAGDAHWAWTAASRNSRMSPNSERRQRARAQLSSGTPTA